jgi:hypothetical protein
MIMANMGKTCLGEKRQKTKGKGRDGMNEKEGKKRRIIS